MPTYTRWSVECPLGCGKAFKAWESEKVCEQRLVTHLMNSSNHMDLVSCTQLPSFRSDADDRFQNYLSLMFMMCAFGVVCNLSG